MDQDKDPKGLDPIAWVEWARSLLRTGRYFFRSARASQWYQNGKQVRDFRTAYAGDDSRKVYCSTGRRYSSGGAFFPAKWARSVALWEKLPDGKEVKRDPAQLADLPPAWILENVPGSAA